MIRFNQSYELKCPESLKYKEVLFWSLTRVFLQWFLVSQFHIQVDHFVVHCVDIPLGHLARVTRCPFGRQIDVHLNLVGGIVQRTGTDRDVRGGNRQSLEVSRVNGGEEVDGQLNGTGNQCEYGLGWGHFESRLICLLGCGQICFSHELIGLSVNPDQTRHSFGCTVPEGRPSGV